MEIHVCRVCLQFQNEHKFLSLFETNNDCKIVDKITSVVNIDIQEGDGFPDRICPDCVIHLESALAFKKKCEDSNTVLLTTSKYKPLSDYKNLLTVKEEEVADSTTCEGFETDCFQENEEHIKSEDIKSEHIKIEPNIQNKSVKTHKKTTEIIKCDDCGSDFQSKCKLRIHWKKTHLPEKLTCPRCKRNFKSYKAYNRHNKHITRACLAGQRCRIEITGKSRTFHCLKCSYISSRAKDMDCHLVIHGGQRRYKCDRCDKFFTQQSSLQAHKESFHKEYIVDTTCHFCGKGIKGRNKLYRHLSSHKLGRVECDICKKSFKTKEYLRLHVLRHNEVKPFACDKCPSTFYTARELTNHVLRIHESRVFKCDICGFILKTLPQHKIHKARHTSTNKVCLICGKFFESECLAAHQKLHFRDNNYPCPLCDKSFPTSRARANHVNGKHKCTMKMAAEKAKERLNIKLKN